MRVKAVRQATRRDDRHRVGANLIFKARGCSLGTWEQVEWPPQ